MTKTTCTKQTRTTPPQSQNPELFSVVTFYMLFFLTLIFPDPRPALSIVRPCQLIVRSKRFVRSKRWVTIRISFEKPRPSWRNEKRLWQNPDERRNRFPLASYHNAWPTQSPPNETMLLKLHGRNGQGRNHTHTQRVKSTVLFFCRKYSYKSYHRLVRTVFADVATRLDETDKDDNPTVHILLSSPLHPCFLTLVLPNSRPVLSTVRPWQCSKKSKS
jgi:hypothetical protein